LQKIKNFSIFAIKKRVYFLSKDLYFPPISQASPEGILAVGGDLSSERLLLAYQQGIFPWYNDDEPKLWWSPPKRMVLFFENLKISKSMKNIINKQTFTVTYNTNFREVISNCQKSPRKNQDGTWITNEIIEAYCKLHQQGIAKSVEVWQNNQLVGGLYGIDLGTVFCGESMFSKVSNASKIAFITLAQKLQSENYKIIDCQVHNDHLESLGCAEISRKQFLEILQSTK
jgi:leucyl/phenylalanyl-tRNA---protein transferase